MLPKKYRYLYKEPGPKMLVEAIKLYGETEIPGKASNPVILAMAYATGLKEFYTNDDIAWCSLFIRYLAHVTGKPYRDTNLMAKSWLKWGDPVMVPELGDVLIFWRGKPSAPTGHVGLYVGESKTNFFVLGGNQDNQINIVPISKKRLQGARRLYSIGKPSNVRRIILDGSDGPVSTNEA